MNVSHAVMIIDDDEDDRMWLAEAFKEVEPNFRIVHASSAREGLVILQDEIQDLPELIFLDMNMPLMNGLQCLEQMRKESRLKDTLVVVYTTAPLIPNADKFKEFDPVYFLSKPSRFKEIVEAIHELLVQHWTNHK